MENHRKQVTIRDVAREAGVSRQTVSRAFNNKGEISETTKQHVLEVARRMGYRPSGLARSLSTNRTHTVGVLVPNISHHFFAVLAEGAEFASTAAGYGVFLINTFKDHRREKNALDALWDRRVDGAILYASFLTEEQLKEYIERFQHVVFINCQDVPEGVGHTASINIDDEQGARLAVSHLIDSGHKRIAILAFPEKSISGRRRLTGYRAALTERGLSADEALILEIPFSTQPKQDMLTTFLTQHPDITAILAHNDLLAVAAMQACHQLGRKVPDDIAIIGFDDIPVASLITPTLTTVRVGKHTLGKLAMRTLIDLIEGKHDTVERNQIITPELVVRDSAP